VKILVYIYIFVQLYDHFVAPTFTMTSETSHLTLNSNPIVYELTPKDRNMIFAVQVMNHTTGERIKPGKFSTVVPQFYQA